MESAQRQVVSRDGDRPRIVGGIVSGGGSTFTVMMPGEEAFRTWCAESRKSAHAFTWKGVPAVHCALNIGLDLERSALPTEVVSPLLDRLQAHFATCRPVSFPVHASRFTAVSFHRARAMCERTVESEIPAVEFNQRFPTSRIRPSRATTPVTVWVWVPPGLEI